MRAVVYDRYGPPEVLRVEDVPRPAPSADQVLVRIASTSLNLSDWECLLGSPFYARIGGLRTPARRTLGSDIAGRVEAVGAAVTRFRPGDEVYGDNLALKGGFAEYAVAPESALAHKPEGLTFSEASTIPQAGAIALQGTADAAPGKRVLINGAGGGSGSFAIQLAKRAGCARDRCRQRRQARLHAVAGRRRGDRLPHATTSPAAPSRTTGSSISSPIARCSPTGGRWPRAVGIAVSAGRCRHCCESSRPARSPVGSRVAGSACSGCTRGRRISSRSPNSASPDTSGSTSTARSRSKRYRSTALRGRGPRPRQSRGGGRRRLSYPRWGYPALKLGRYVGAQAAARRVAALAAVWAARQGQSASDRICRIPGACEGDVGRPVPTG